MNDEPENVTVTSDETAVSADGESTEPLGAYRNPWPIQEADATIRRETKPSSAPWVTSLRTVKTGSHIYLPHERAFVITAFAIPSQPCRDPDAVLAIEIGMRLVLTWSVADAMLRYRVVEQGIAGHDIVERLLAQLASEALPPTSSAAHAARIVEVATRLATAHMIVCPTPILVPSRQNVRFFLANESYDGYSVGINRDDVIDVRVALAYVSEAQ